MNFMMVLTAIGAGKIAAAQAGADPVPLTHLAVGSAGGSPIAPPTSAATTLVQERWRGLLSAGLIDAEDPSVITVEAVIPAASGGWMIHEIGVFDEDGDLFAYGSFPAHYKPLAAEGAASEMVVQASIRVASTAAVTIVVDTSLVTATRAWALSEFLRKSQNLADLTDVPAARANLGLDTAFFAPFLRASQNLADVTDATAARSNIGFSDAEAFFNGSGL